MKLFAKNVIAPEREIVELKHGADGLFEQPDWSKMTKRQLQQYATAMQKRRMRAAHDADFADEVTGLTNTNDPTGDYLCKACNKEIVGRCVAVAVKRDDLDRGFKSCNKYENKCVGDPELDAPMLEPAEAGFAEAERPWGCKNCSMKESSNMIDQLGRDLWCRRWAFTMKSTNCCGENDNPQIPLNADGTRKKLVTKGKADSPSLVHTPGKMQLQNGGKKRRPHLGRSALYQKRNVGDELIEILKARDVSAQPRDDHGRWTTAAQQAEHVAADAMHANGIRPHKDPEGNIHSAFKALAAAGHAKAAQLAQSIRHTVLSTRFAGASPLANGGVEIRLRHTTAGSANIKPARIDSTVQIHPSHLVSAPHHVQQALRLAHNALAATGRAPAQPRHPPVSATFSRE
jgi:hypothetical protein